VPPWSLEAGSGGDGRFLLIHSRDGKGGKFDRISGLRSLNLGFNPEKCDEATGNPIIVDCWGGDLSELARPPRHEIRDD